MLGHSGFNFGGCKIDSKITSVICHILGYSLVWHSKMQACVSLSTTKVEYIVVRSCCAQSIGMKH